MNRLALVLLVGAAAAGLAAVVVAEDAAPRPFPRSAEPYALPKGTEFTAMEADYARACVAYVEARLNVLPAQNAWTEVITVRRAFTKAAPPSAAGAAPDRPLPASPPPLAEDLPAKSGASPPPSSPAPVPESKPETRPDATPPAPRPVPVPAPAVAPGDASTLVAGTGFEAVPAAASVAGKELLPVAPERTAGLAIVWGTSREPLNLFDSAASNAPMHVEASLNGGPWLAARCGEIRVPDLGPGNYQIRLVAWPSKGRTIVLAPIVLERTKDGWTRR